MIVEEGIPLAPFTTFGIGGSAERFARIASGDDLRDLERLVRATADPLTILGGGSNVLIADGTIEGIVARIEIPGIDLGPARGIADVVAGAGVPWDELVAATVEGGFWGLENLSGIPGTVGASPVQNIGAYGKEVAQAIHWVEAFDRVTMKTKRLDASECRFGYRESVFKREAGGSLVVTRVAFSLSRDARPSLAYADLAARFPSGAAPSAHEVRAAVLDIRAKKFPEGGKGTAGSFFKNPIVTMEKAKSLAERFPGVPTFPVTEGKAKVSAAWLIDRVAGMRGTKRGNVSSFERQALVLVARPGSRATEVVDFAREIASRVEALTGVELEPEVRFVGHAW